MKKSIQDKLEHLSRRLAELDLLLSSETATQDMDAYRKLYAQAEKDLPGFWADQARAELLWHKQGPVRRAAPLQ